MAVVGPSFRHYHVRQTVLYRLVCLLQHWHPRYYRSFAKGGWESTREHWWAMAAALPTLWFAFGFWTVKVAAACWLAWQVFPFKCATPVVVTPRWGRRMSADELCEHLRRRTELDVQALIKLEGGVLLRGFGLRTKEDFAKVCEAIGYRFCPLRGSRVTAIYKDKVNDYMWKIDTEGAAPSAATRLLGVSWEDKFIMNRSFHSEHYYTEPVPRVLMFACEEPAPCGGRTLVSDTRKAFRRVPPECRYRLEELVYVVQHRLDLRSREADRFIGETEDAYEGDGEELGAYTDAELDARAGKLRAVCAEKRYAEPEHLGGHVYKIVTKPRNSEHPTNVTGFVHFNLLGAVNVRGEEVSSLDFTAATIAHWFSSTFFTWRRGDIMFFDNLKCGHAGTSLRGHRVLYAGMFQDVEAPPGDWRRVKAA